MGQEWWARSCKTNSTNVLLSCSLTLFLLKIDLLASNRGFKWSYGSHVNMLQRLVLLSFLEEFDCFSFFIERRKLIPSMFLFS